MLVHSSQHNFVGNFQLQMFAKSVCTNATHKSGLFDAAAWQYRGYLLIVKKRDLDDFLTPGNCPKSHVLFIYIFPNALSSSAWTGSQVPILCYPGEHTLHWTGSQVPILYYPGEQTLHWFEWSVKVELKARHVLVQNCHLCESNR